MYATVLAVVRRLRRPVPGARSMLGRSRWSSPKPAVLYRYSLAMLIIRALGKIARAGHGTVFLTEDLSIYPKPGKLVSTNQKTSASGDEGERSDRNPARMG